MKKITDPRLEAYFALMESRPGLFADSPLLPIQRDPEAIRAFTARTGKAIGVLYQSPYNMLVTDLIQPPEGEPYVYERIIPTDPDGVVAMALHQGKFLLLGQFRHAPRQFQYAFALQGDLTVDQERQLLVENRWEEGAHLYSFNAYGQLVWMGPEEP